MWRITATLGWAALFSRGVHADDLSLTLEQANAVLISALTAETKAKLGGKPAGAPANAPKDPITAVYLSDGKMCPAGMKLAGTDAADGHTFDGNLNKGVQHEVIEQGLSGCDCLPQWRVDNIHEELTPGMQKPKRMWERAYGCRRQKDGDISATGGWCLAKMHRHQGVPTAVCSTGDVPSSVPFTAELRAEESWVRDGRTKRKRAGAALCSPAGLCALAEPCVGEVTHEHAVRTCAALGARLPTVAELRDVTVDGALETTCGGAPNGMLVWTADPCDGGAGMMRAPVVKGGPAATCTNTRVAEKHGRRVSVNTRSLGIRLCVAEKHATVRRVDTYAGGAHSPSGRATPANAKLRDGKSKRMVHHWDRCPAEVIPSPNSRSITLAGCTCKASADGTPGTCQKTPLAEVVTMRDRRAQGAAAFSWCEVEPETCNAKVFVSNRKKVIIGLPRPLTEQADMCTLAADDIRALHLCVGRNPTAGPPIVEVFLAHAKSCASSGDGYEEIGRAAALTGSLNDGTNGLSIRMCLKRSADSAAHPPLADLAVMGGADVIKTCPYGFGTPRHSEIKFQALYNTVELPLNLRAQPQRSLGVSGKRVEHTPWYITICTHFRGSPLSLPPVNALPTVKTVRKNGVLAFLFLVYHQIDNEAMWEIFFEGAPKELRRNWIIIVHHKPGIVLGSWAKRMQANKQLILIPRDRLVPTGYCEFSLVHAQIVLLEAALNCTSCPPEAPQDISHMVFVSGNSLPMQNFATVYESLVNTPAGEVESNMCFEKEGETVLSPYLVDGIVTVAASHMESHRADSSEATSRVARRVLSTLRESAQLSKASQWATFGRKDALWMVNEGWPAALLLGVQKWKFKSYGCADEVLLPSIFKLGNDDFAHEAYTAEHCRTYIVWGRGYSGVVQDAADAVALPPTAGADFQFEASNVYSGGHPDSGVWWQHQASPVVFANIPSTAVRVGRTARPTAVGTVLLTPRALAHFPPFLCAQVEFFVRQRQFLFLRKVADPIRMSPNDIAKLYTDRIATVIG
jgi:hypothetical protein